MPSVQVHGLPLPPEGFEARFEICNESTDLMLSVDNGNPKWMIPSSAHFGDYAIVARRKWEPKPGEDVRCTWARHGRYIADISTCDGYEGPDRHIVIMSDGEAAFLKREDIIGPWEPEAGEELEPEPAIDVGEGYSRIVWDAENPPVRMEGDEFIGSRGEWLKILSDRVNETYMSYDFLTWPHRRRPIAKPWTAPEWARVLGWMTQDHNHSMVVFWNHRPEFHEPWRQWCRGRVTGIEVNGSFSVETAKALNLYPPHWDTLPVSERIINLSGDVK